MKRVSSFLVKHVFFAAALLLLLPLTAAELCAQENDLEIFGSMQTIFMHQESQLKLRIPELNVEQSGTETRNTFALQQLDIFLRKEMSDALSAFIDLEFQLNYASDKGWGSMSLQEAWLDYHVTDAFSLKAGLLYPAFNRLNEIKNRLPLLPYIFRPLVYERLLSGMFRAEDFIPEHAFLQLYGSVPLGDFFADYAVYTGNGESSYISRSGPDGTIETDVNSNFEFLTGVDPTDFKLKLFGGRVGLRTRDELFSAGLSLTHDRNNLRDTTGSGLYVIPDDIRERFGSDAPRIRIGTDLALRLGALYFEGEVIKILYDYEGAESLDLAMEQGFVHAMLGYDFFPSLTSYVSMQWGDYTFGFDSDYFVYSVGGAWRINGSVTAKAQMVLYEERFDDIPVPDAPAVDQKVDITFVFLGFSVLL